MSEFHDQLWKEFTDPDYRIAYAESFLDAWIALQIRTVREQRGMTQKQLAQALDTTQTAISRLESANYSGRTISTLKNVASKLDCRLKVSLETYGSLIGEADKLSTEFLRRPSFKDALTNLGNLPSDMEGHLKNSVSQSSGIAEMSRGEVLQVQPRNPAHDSLRKVAA